MFTFVPARYEITTEDGRPVTAGLFKSADGLLDVIRGQRRGTYRVYRRLGWSLHLEGESELWGEFVHRGGGEVASHLIPVEERSPV